MRGGVGKYACAAAAAGALAIGIPAAASGHDPRDHRRHHHGRGIEHVLLISVDGLHQSDLVWYVQHHPGLGARQAGRQAEPSTRNAQTPIPSDSTPGMTAQLTGGNPRTTGVYYDDRVQPRRCFRRARPRARAPRPVRRSIYDSPDDINANALDAGEGLSGLPGKHPANDQQSPELLNPATFPVDPTTCKPIYPNQYLEVNTIFNVAHDAGLVTAWSDKHPIYSSFDGPAGNGLTDQFDPEIDSTALEPNRDSVPGDILDGRQRRDDAVRLLQGPGRAQRIDGYDHQRHAAGRRAGDLRDELPDRVDGREAPHLRRTDRRLLPRYGTRPDRCCSGRCDYIDDQVERMVDELRSQGLVGSTAIIISAKHGQSPQDPNQLTRIDDTPIINGVNAAWAATHPERPAAGRLRHRRRRDHVVAVGPLAGRGATSSSTTCGRTRRPATRSSGGIADAAALGAGKIYAGRAAARYFGVPVSDPRHPDVWGVVQHRRRLYRRQGQDRRTRRRKPGRPRRADPRLRSRRRTAWAVRRPVETTQIAPTIIRLLGLDPDALQAVQIEGTRVLPGIGR